MKFIELSEQERKAVKEALEDIGYFDVAESPEMIQEWLDDGTISIVAGTSGRDIVWIIGETHESGLYIDTLESLSQEEIKKEEFIHDEY